ncbi:hypothetical protein BKA05_001354 [Nocardioides marinus]|uniref:Uncharacterized protein n=1 Tax=Nocardioides marinus TaxID=374514 RepID=A0A7Y9YDM9_9ACTN|nr:hypothetical protein [Nocardioides marinus]
MVQSSAARDAHCAAHGGEAPSVPYAFGPATAYGYAY